MGALYSGRCFSTSADAATAYYSGVGPSVLAGSPPILSTVEWDGVGWYLVSRQGGAVVSSVGAPAISFAECNAGQSFAEGAGLGMLVVSVWLVAWKFSVLKRVIR